MLIPSAYLHTFLATNGNQQGWAMRSFGQ
jgi:hypothetical protein